MNINSDSSAECCLSFHSAVYSFIPKFEIVAKCHGFAGNIQIVCPNVHVQSAQCNKMKKQKHAHWRKSSSLEWNELGSSTYNLLFNIHTCTIFHIHNLSRFLDRCDAMNGFIKRWNKNGNNNNKNNICDKTMTMRKTKVLHTKITEANTL